LANLVGVLLVPEPGGGFALDHAHGVGDRDIRWYQQDKVEMVGLDVEL